MEIILAPSILAADFATLGEQIKKTEEAGAKYLHFDVMDGHFVPSISFGAPVLASIRPITSQKLDVHLMIDEPIRYLQDFKNAGADIITVHLEACKDILHTLETIRKYGLKTGISIKPNTPVSTLEPLLDKVDMVLIMSVEPGFGGQALIAETLDKVRELRQIINSRKHEAMKIKPLEKGLPHINVENISKTYKEIDIQVDGGIYQENLQEVLEAGANIIVAGSGVFKGDIEENVKGFLKIFEDFDA